MQPDPRQYWNNFYSADRSEGVPHEPSAFATWVEETQLPVGAAVWEFGFGTGRDALWFASQGHSVRGFDFAESAVTTARTLATKQGVGARFSIFDLETLEGSSRLFSDAQGHSGLTVYGRFLIHSLTDQARWNFLELASVLLAEGGSLLLEFRTDDDRRESHLFGEDHFRQYLHTNTVVSEIDALGGIVTARVEGRGLAVYKTEDPHVARLVAAWRP